MGCSVGIIDSFPLSLFDGEYTRLKFTPAYTGFDGTRHPAGYADAGTIEGDMQDISADELARDTAGMYQTGDIRMYTTADLALQDRVQEPNGWTWEVIAFVSRSRILQPSRNEYLLRRVDTTEN